MERKTAEAITTKKAIEIEERLIKNNYSARPEGEEITTIVMHYTAGGTFESNIEWLDNPEAKASAHYLVGRKGRIARLVSEDLCAWHAGQSRFHGRAQVNSFSIGIELENNGLEPFPLEQIDSAAKLVADIMNRRKGIEIDRVVGHSDVAPGRKIDPGPFFPWPLFRSIILDNLC